MHHRCQQCLVAKWLGLSFTVRVRVGEWGFSVLFLSVLKFSDDVTRRSRLWKSQYNVSCRHFVMRGVPWKLMEPRENAPCSRKRVGLGKIVPSRVLVCTTVIALIKLALKSECSSR